MLKPFGGCYNGNEEFQKAVKEMYDEKVERTCQGQTNDIKCCWIGDEYQVVDDDEIFMEEVGQQVCN